MVSIRNLCQKAKSQGFVEQLEWMIIITIMNLFSDCNDLRL